MNRFIALMFCLSTLLSIVGCTRGVDTPPTTTQKESVSSSTVPTEAPKPEDDAPLPCTHDFETATKDSTCTEGGYITKTCRLCGQEESEAIAPTGHRFMDATCAVPKTCSSCGTVEGKELGHSFVNGACQRCGTVPPAADCEHNYQLTDLVAATCTEDGMVTYTCSSCGYHYSSPTPAKGHSFTDATCLSAEVCSVCTVTEGTPLGHSYGADHLCIRCGAEDPDQPAQTGDFTITVRNKSGKTVADVTVTVFVDDSATAAGSARTGTNGKATIPVTVGSSYKVVLSTIPAGYSAKESYTFRSLTANVTLTTTPVLDPNDHSNAQYKVGSTMADFTLTDTDGNTYTLSELLETKDAVILNFWFVNCGPCKAEFPHFEEVYQQYSDSVQLLALNHFDGEKQIRDLRDQMGLTFPMIRENIGMKEGFNITAYPTTVVIGQNGKILKIHTGSYTLDEVIELFEAYAH